MAKIKESRNAGKAMHYAVGAVIEKDGKYLLIDRSVKPYAFALVAGHINEGETPEEALVREVKEESGLKVLSYEKIFEREIKNRECSKGKASHYCYLFNCSIEGRIDIDPKEVKDIAWYSKDEIKRLELEHLARFFFKKIGVI